MFPITAELYIWKAYSDVPLCSASIFSEADQALWRLVSLEEGHAARLHNHKTLGVIFMIWSKNMRHILTTVNVPILPCDILARERERERKKKLSKRIGGNMTAGYTGTAHTKSFCMGLNPQSILCCLWDTDYNTERLCGFHACCVSNKMHVWYCRACIVLLEHFFHIIRAFNLHKCVFFALLWGGKLHKTQKETHDQLPNESAPV